MAGPWDKYAQPEQSGPWLKFAKPKAEAEAPQTARQQYEAMGFRHVMDANDGAVLQNAEGKRVYTSPGYNTSDPEEVAKIIKGGTVAGLMRDDIDRDLLAKHPIAARVQEFNQGVPIIGEWMDEAAALVSPGRAQSARALSDAMERQHPIQSGALNVLGGIASTAPLALAGAGAKTADWIGRAGSKIGRVARVAGAGAVAGGVEGAASGAGRGEGLEGRARGAAVQGAIGAGLGATLAPVADLLGYGAKELAARFKRMDVRTIADEFGVDAASARVIKQALLNDDLGAASARLGQLGDDAMLADAGPATQALLDAASKTGGKALATTRDAVESRAATFGQRLPGKLDTILGVSVKGVKTTAREISQGTAALRGAAYDKAYSTAINYADDAGRKIEGVFARIPSDTLNAAIKEANEAMQAEGIQNLQIMARIGKDGKVTFSEMPNVRQLDEIKKALGTVAKAGVDQFGRPTAQGLRAKRLAGELRDAITEAVPSYKTALRLGGDKLQRDEALDLGKRLLFKNVTVEDVRDFTKSGLSVEAREAAAQGLRDTIETNLSNVRRTITDPNVDAREAMQLVKELSSRANITKVRMVLGPAKANALIEELDKQATALLLRGAVARNSDTAIRGAIKGQVDAEAAPGLVRQTIGNMGNPLEAVQGVTRAAAGTDARSVNAAQQAVYAQIADALTRIKGQDAQRALAAVKGAMAGQPLRDEDARLIGRMVGTSAFQLHQGVQQNQLSPRSN